jgi:hypothetical protein
VSDASSVKFIEMRLVFFFTGLIAIGSLLDCNRKCDSYTDKPLTGKIEDFFRVYKPGNWWVYRNKSGTKADSQYVVNYEEIFTNNRTSCERNQQRTFAIVNSQLPGGPPQYSYGDSLFLVYKKQGNGITVRLGIPFGSNSKSANFPEFHYSLDTDSITSFPYPGSLGVNGLDSIFLNGMKYYSILLGNDGSTTFYIAKDKGLVGWGNTLDTFNLVDFKIF